MIDEKMSLEAVRRAEAVLRPLGALTVDMQQACVRGNAEKVEFCDENAVLLKHRSGIYMLWAKTEADGVRALESLESDDPLYRGMRLCVAHGRAALDAVIHTTQLTYDKACIQFCRYSKQKLPLEGIGTIRLLTRKDLPVVAETYKHMTEDRIARAIDEGLMYGLELDGELAAFIGWHSEGSCGMLEVMKKYRRRGIGTELEGYMHNLHIDRGWVPYGQVYTDNEASLSMQTKFELDRSSDYIWWTFRPDMH